MKKTLLIILPLLLIVGCSKPVEDSTLINKDGLMYLPDSDEPYSGEVFTNYSSGEKEYQGTYENGLLVTYSYLNKDGSVKEPVNGENLIDRGGLLYETNGQKLYTGDVFELYEDGNRKYTGSLKGGKKDKLWTEWYENGQKYYEGSYKGGKKDGNWTVWYANGQKYSKVTYKLDNRQGLGLYYTKNGNTYKTIQIGDQVWMAENLKVTHYRDGTAIPTGHSDSDWSHLSTGAYAVYGGKKSNAYTYGYLYNWYAVTDSRNIAPKGWHVPTDDEWKTLEMHLGMSQSEADDEGRRRGTVEGKKLKEEGTDHWKYHYKRATNESGFTALPGGDRSRHGRYGKYGYMGYYGYFWSSTEFNSLGAWYRTLYYDYSDVGRQGGGKWKGFSVRCVRD